MTLKKTSCYIVLLAATWLSSLYFGLYLTPRHSLFTTYQAAELWSNNAKSTLSSGITNSQTSIVVANGSGFPSPTGGDYCWSTLDDGSFQEIVKVTARSSNTFTVTRGQQGTTARAFAAGTRFELRVTKQTLLDLQSAAPTNATYITQTANSSLSAEQALAALSTGYMKVTTTTGAVTSQAVPIPVADGGTGATTFSSNLPLIGAGASAVTTGTRSGNTTAYVTTTGTQTSGDCVSIDASGNHVAAGAACGAGSLTLADDKVSSTAGDVTVTSTSFGDVSGISITGTTGARRVLVVVNATSGAIAASSILSLDIDIDGARVGGAYGLSSIGVGPIGNLGFSYVTDALSAASHTFKLQTKTDFGTCTLKRSSNFPIVMAVQELP